MKEDKGKNYWDVSYYNYWKARVIESENKNIHNSTIVKDDSKIPDNGVYEYLLKKCDFRNGILLDVGCAWGRLFPLYLRNNLKIYGIDISVKMVKEAKKIQAPNLIGVKKAGVEKLPYKDNYFDFICCFGTFDASYQEIALKEMFRVGKNYCKIMFTGKNVSYFHDDEKAIKAEIGANTKGEPNYFTDVKALIKQVEQNGHCILHSFCFLLRGDFAEVKFIETIPDIFYEYCLVLQKKTENYHFEKFSYKKSFVKY